MAVGSNTLGLFFKIGVDSKDAQKELSGWRKLLDDIGKGFVDGLGQGAAKGAKEAANALQDTQRSLKGLQTQVDQMRTGFEALTRGDVVQGVTSLSRIFGPMAVAIGAVALAGVAAAKGIEAVVDAADKVGTDSKEDFEALQESLKGVGTELTLVDHALSQEILKSLDQVKAATTALFVQLLRESGPGLIIFLNDVVKVLKESIPLAQKFGHALLEAFVVADAALRTNEAIANLNKNLSDENKIGTAREWWKVFKSYVTQVHSEVDALNVNLKDMTGTFQDTKGKAPRAVTEVDEFAKALANAQKELDKLRQGTADIIIQNLEDQLKGLNQAIADTFDIKKIAAFKFEMIDFAKFMTAQIDGIIQDTAKLGQAIPGGGKDVPGLPDDATIQEGLDKAFKHYESFFERLKEGFASVGTTITDRLGKAIEELPIQIIDAFTNSFKNLLDVFIETGHTGPAVMRQFAAAVLRTIAQLASQLAALAFGYALLMLAFQDYKDAALAAAAGVALTALAVGLGYAAGKVGPSQAGAAAGGGSFGGDTTQAPGTVTINQGATSALGIQLQILDALNNITTAPPGDVLQRGAEQNPMVVGQANNEAARRDGTVSREFLQISGLRTA
jgi:hypothetical protein